MLIQFLILIANNFILIANNFAYRSSEVNFQFRNRKSEVIVEPGLRISEFGISIHVNFLAKVKDRCNFFPIKLKFSSRRVFRIIGFLNAFRVRIFGSILRKGYLNRTLSYRQN